MNTKEIEEAVSLGDKLGVSGLLPKDKLDILLSLAKEYLAVKGMPEEIKYSTDKDGYATKTLSYVEGFNQALHLCKLAMIKAVPSEGDIVDICGEIYDCPTCPLQPVCLKHPDWEDGEQMCYLFGKRIATTLHKLYLEKLGIKDV